MPSGAGDIILIQRLDSNDQGIKLQDQVPAQTPSQLNSNRGWAISRDVTPPFRNVYCNYKGAEKPKREHTSARPSL